MWIVGLKGLKLFLLSLPSPWALSFHIADAFCEGLGRCCEGTGKVLIMMFNF